MLSLGYLMPRVRTFHLAPIFLALGAGCKPTDHDTHLQSLVFDKRAMNLAAMFVGDASGLTGVYQDTGNLSQALRQTDWNFNVVVNGPDPSDDRTPQSASQIMDSFVRYSVDLLNTPYATMFFYYTGHGAEDGSLITAGDGGFFFSDLALKVKEARGQQAFKRLVVLVDACFSGQLATGSQRISAALTDGAALAPGSVSLPVPPDNNVTSDAVAKGRRIAAAIANNVASVGRGLADELIVFTASAPNETSGDEFNGGTGTLAFIRALQMAQSNPMTTIEQFYQMMTGNAFGQTPQLNTEPPMLRQLPIIGPDSNGMPAAAPVSRGADPNNGGWPPAGG